MRLFVAIDLSSGLRTRIAELQAAMRREAAPVRWVAADRIHLTLRFIGEVAAGAVGAIEPALQGIVNPATGPFRLRTAGIGTFPERGRPRVLWIGVHDEGGAAARLAGAIDAALEPLGFPAEQRPFRPHLTIGRFPGAGAPGRRPGLQRFATATAGEFDVDRFHLFESRLGQGGATYRILSSYVLTGGATI